MLSKDFQSVLKPCLWGTDINSLDIEKDKFLIIERLLEHGGDKQVEFIMKTYDTESISKVVISSAYLSPKTVNYWCLILELKREDTKCFMRRFPKMWPPS